MKRKDWGWLGSVLLWGLFGFWTGDAYRRHDLVGFWIGVALWVVLPVGAAVKILVSQALWRREWERRYGMPWSQSEAARMERENDR
jgi:hypothetical protein